MSVCTLKCEIKHICVHVRKYLFMRAFANVRYMWKGKIIYYINQLSTRWWNIGKRKHSFIILDLGPRCNSVVSLTPRPFHHQYTLEAGWDPESVWTVWNKNKSLVLVGNRNSAVQFLARRYANSRLLFVKITKILKVIQFSLKCSQNAVNPQ
jgi:hypothetical protein